MKREISDEFVHYESPYLALAFARSRPLLAHFGVESGGRLRGHVESNLLAPGFGGRAPALSGCDPIRLSDSGCAYPATDGGWDVRFQDERTFRVNAPLRGAAPEFFRFSFRPAVSPVTVWGRWLEDKAFPPHRAGSLLEVPDVVVDYRLPALVHFPDHGLVRIESDAPGVILRQTMRADPAMIGLNLGSNNTAGHCSRVAYHHGLVELGFIAAGGEGQIALIFRVEEERVPEVEGADFGGSRWDGLRRCWQNAFTLNPETLSMGDNPLLHGVAHLAVHYKSDMSLFTPGLIDGMTVHDVLGHQLEITFGECVSSKGEINSRHAVPGAPAEHGEFGFFDGNVSNLIALRNHIAATGDWGFARRHLARIKQAGMFLLALDKDGDGILELPFDGNHFRNDRECRNWWDNFSFGHKDGFVNLLACRALGNLADVLEGMGEDAGPFRKWRSAFLRSFHPTFFNPASGLYAGWISADGRAHDYAFTFMPSMAVNEGLVDRETGAGMLRILLEKLRAEGYGEWKWGIPGPLISVSESDGHIWSPMQRWGSYENGGFCGQTAYHFIQALYCVGMRDQADEILFTMIGTFEKEPTHSGVFPGYMKSVDWRTREGIPCGYNYLADNYYFLLAAVTGHFGKALPGLT